MTARAHRLHRKGGWPADQAADRVTLDYAERFLRRRRLATASGGDLLVDLAETVSLDDGDAFETEDGRFVAVVAKAEPLIAVTGPRDQLTRLAWHIGNRHTPAQITPDRILIRHDHVLADMLARLGARIERVEAPFTPEGGAYGHGRTHGHHHGGAGDDPHAGITDAPPHGHGHHHHHDHRPGPGQAAGHPDPGAPRPAGDADA